jgi:phosphoglycolate phosphatase
VRYTTVIFDLDGTLLNTLSDLHASTNHALAAHGLPPRSLDEVRSFVGNGIRNLIRLAVPTGSSDELIDTVHADFDAHYAVHNMDQTGPYPGVIELVKTLRDKGIRCCVVSNKGDYAVQPLVQHFFPNMFDVVCGEREKDGIRRKPWPDTVLECMRVVGATKGESVYVGDSEVDLLTAANAGIDCIAVTWGFRDEDFLRAQGATVLTPTAPALARLLLA